MKLWQKQTKLDAAVEAFTVDDDWELDNQLVWADAATNLAHAHALQKAGLLSAEELQAIKGALQQVVSLHAQGLFPVKPEDEDVHTAVENFLTEELGETGAKIHAGKSRNDQVLCDTRLHAKKELLAIGLGTVALANALAVLAGQHEKTLMPGYTHSRKAMPSTLGLWFAAHAEALADDVEGLLQALALIDQCPLGSAAGYGSQLPLDRELEAKLLGFAGVQNNVLYAQNSRGKFEAVVLAALQQVMLDLGKLSADAILFSMPEFGFLSLPEKFCTGSSIMPQKKNPDVFELLRGKASVVGACLFQVANLVAGLPSGYHRDYQLTKEPLLKGLKTAREAVSVALSVVQGLKGNPAACLAACSPEIFSAWQALESAKKGVPFRSAYQETAKKLPGGKPLLVPAFSELFNAKLLGSPAALGLPQLKEKLSAKEKSLEEKSRVLASAWKKLWGKTHAGP
ncbi:MAG: argininosuccinate lyase [Candidatus Diapherotrites archaeon]|uniref:Argininosuccinate lyase n=1 Tax=Candidatus Iainarchaeum sp. TaxID=3101447 RepID=A0A8T4L4K2_9ARCH|nr:argininosuccinate lyase [Candidatus Diapherotrites archaeon]